jgi:DNA-binding response OmpR family regulator
MGARILVVDDSPTIRRVVGAILERHGYVPTYAEDGQKALEQLRQGGADLVLVDFVMPRMNGYQFCMSLRRDDALRETPIVLMSAKGDRIRGKFVQQTGAVDAITKPFDARSLVAVVQSALEKRDKREPGAEVRLEPDEELNSSPSQVEAGLARTEASAARVSEHLSKLFFTELRRFGVEVEASTLVSVFARSLSKDAGAELLALLLDSEFASSDREVLAGDLAAVSIAEILQLLDMQRKTGTLTVSHKHARITFFLRGGALDFATYAGLPEEFLLGRYLVQAGALSRSDLEQGLSESQRTGEILGEHLVRTQALREDQLRPALSGQTSELVYEVVRWRTGRFRFTKDAEGELAKKARLGLTTAGLVMEGFRRVDEWRLIEGTFEFSDVFLRDDIALGKLGPSDLTQRERRVLQEIDGERSIAQIIDDLEFGSFETCKLLYRLVNARLVQRR